MRLHWPNCSFASCSRSALVSAACIAVVALLSFPTLRARAHCRPSPMRTLLPSSSSYALLITVDPASGSQGLSNPARETDRRSPGGQKQKNMWAVLRQQGAIGPNERIGTCCRILSTVHRVPWCLLSAIQPLDPGPPARVLYLQPQARTSRRTQARPRRRLPFHSDRPSGGPIHPAGPRRRARAGFSAGFPHPPRADEVARVVVSESPIDTGRVYGSHPADASVLRPVSGPFTDPVTYLRRLTADGAVLPGLLLCRRDRRRATGGDRSSWRVVYGLQRFRRPPSAPNTRVLLEGSLASHQVWQPVCQLCDFKTTPLGYGLVDDRPAKALPTSHWTVRPAPLPPAFPNSAHLSAETMKES
jgi:hypothetical protein